jgi:hypothetical protein
MSGFALLGATNGRSEDPDYNPAGAVKERAQLALARSRLSSHSRRSVVFVLAGWFHARNGQTAMPLRRRRHALLGLATALAWALANTPPDADT